MKQVILYGGEGCCLCDKAKAWLEQLQPAFDFSLAVIDVRADQALAGRYGTRIPVVAIDGVEVLEGKVSEFWLRKALRGEPIRKAL